MNKNLTITILALGVFLTFIPAGMAHFNVPEPGSSSLLLGVSLAGIAVARMFWPKKGS